MKHRTVTGRIRYTSEKQGMEGQERGRECFVFTHHTDGSVIMRARCEIEEPKPTVLRDIVYHIGPDMVAQNLLVHLTLGDEFLGSGWMHHDAAAGTLECESYGPGIGRNSEMRENVGSFDGFGTHPVVGDGYLSRIVDVSRGPHTRRLRVFLPSPDHRGATAPQIAEVEIDLEYVGEEEKTVAAGTFACRHFRFVDNSEEGMGGETHPDYDVWISADDDAILIYGSIDGYMMNRYELVALER
ncbi:hypothetical protein [Aurantiacibacter aquimixticola]|uniref:DUF3108 domain-containing protein n=1 Tax=Aurantiacibacter aquimixticola TaxID=1958945 RepID=A0A419RW72_9SPHN|nr:hypothetical protein [Aurantiacibacter aquimixticola]RJY10036.1 hypothetical protein D6201_12345 [Aurantiacibacter aquimixticola]